jgi:hypothetical protein
VVHQEKTGQEKAKETKEQKDNQKNKKYILGGRFLLLSKKANNE